MKRLAPVAVLVSLTLAGCSAGGFDEALEACEGSVALLLYSGDVVAAAADEREMAGSVDHICELHVDEVGRDEFTSIWLDPGKRAEVLAEWNAGIG